MVDNVNINIQGFAEFQKMLSELNDNVQKEIMKKGFAEASKPLIKQAQENINSNRVKKSIGVKLTTEGSTALIGARKFKPYSGYLAPWFEDGTKERQYISKKKKGFFGIEKKVHKTGKMKATKFFTRAVDSAEPQMLKNIEQVFIDVMNKVLAKFNK
jgi:hypothetical protein